MPPVRRRLRSLVLGHTPRCFVKLPRPRDVSVRQQQSVIGRDETGAREQRLEHRCILVRGHEWLATRAPNWDAVGAHDHPKGRSRSWVDESPRPLNEGRQIWQ